MNCVAAILARNEGGRYLSLVLETLQPLCKTILLLDDGSTDDTVDVAVQHGAIVKHREASEMWGNESPAREELWEWGREFADDGWVLICDADQLMIAPPADWMLMLTSNVPAWGIPLYDCWNRPDQFRSDGYWKGYQVARPWLFRPSACPNPDWSSRGIHTGHCPQNFPGPIALAPEGVYWKHLGWMDPEERKRKIDRYLTTSHLLTPEELAHLRSAEDA